MPHKFLPRPNPALYEINTAAWLFELSRKAGKSLRLADVPSSEWDRLKKLGMDYVWLLGVWSRSQEGRKISQNDADFRKLFDSVLPGCRDEDIIGSCFAVGDNEPDPLIGSWDDIDRVREELHRREMGLILDFIPNHKGLDHVWLREHPEYFIQVPRGVYERDKSSFFSLDYQGRTLYIAHGKDPYFPAWTDTAQINFFNPAAQQALLDWLKLIAAHCDGVRCDMAMLVLKDVFQKTWGWANRDPSYDLPPEEFWQLVTRDLPGTLFIAEAYWDTEWTLQQLGFDYVYDKKLYDRLKNGSAREVLQHLKGDRLYQSKLLRFIENHDESRSAAVFTDGKLEAAAALFSSLPGMKLYFHGQFEGRQIHMPIQIRQTRQEADDPLIQAFYAELLPVINQDAFHRGQWKLKEVLDDGKKSWQSIVACLWSLGDQHYLVLANLSPKNASGRVSFEDDVAEEADYSLQGKLEPQHFTRSGKVMAHPGLDFRLAGYQAQIYQIERLS